MENPYPIGGLEEIQRMLLAGDKIGAIKLYREKSGAGLAEAKSAVEQMQTQLRGFESAELKLPTAAPTASAPSAAVNEALFAGNKIQAIKLYREQMKVGLAEAKRAVEQIEGQLRLSAPGLFANPPRKGCMVFLFLGALAGGTMLAVTYACQMHW